MRSFGVALLALGCWWLARRASAGRRAGAGAPDLDFLEYLGAWAEEDDEWLAIEEWQKDNSRGARREILKGPR